MAAVYDQVLRALVYQAFDAKGTPAFHDAIAEIVDTHTRWPLVQYAIELRYARTILKRRTKWLAESVRVMQATYPARLEEAA